jgi:hypothetical protein
MNNLIALAKLKKGILNKYKKIMACFPRAGEHMPL